MSKFILHSDGCGITNVDNMLRAYISGRGIIAHMVDGSSHPIAEYESPDEARAVFNELVNEIVSLRFPKNEV